VAGEENVMSVEDDCDDLRESLLEWRGKYWAAKRYIEALERALHGHSKDWRYTASIDEVDEFDGAASGWREWSGT
jgi:hypothetical protein